jgi:hypothetical protein
LSAIVVAVALAVALVFGVLTTLEAEGIPASAHRQPDPSDPASNRSGGASAAGIAGRRPADLEASGTASVPWTLGNRRKT